MSMDISAVQWECFIYLFTSFNFWGLTSVASTVSSSRNIRCSQVPTNRPGCLRVSVTTFPSGSGPSHRQQRNSLPYSEPDESWRLELTCSCELLAADNIDMWKWNPHHISETDLETGFGNKESSPVSQRRLRTVRMDHKAYDCACALGLVVLVVEM